MSTVIHCSVDVRGVLKYPLRQFKRVTQWILKPDGTRFTPDELREALMDELANGHERLPMGECEGFDYKTGCPGHPSESPAVVA